MSASQPHQAVSDRIIRELGDRRQRGASIFLHDSSPGRGSWLPARSAPKLRARCRHRRGCSHGVGARRCPRRRAGTELLAPALAVGRRPRSRSGGEAGGCACRAAARNRSSRRGSRRRRRSPPGNRGCIGNFSGRRDCGLRSTGALDRPGRRSRVSRARAFRAPHLSGRGFATDRCVALTAGIDAARRCLYRTTGSHLLRKEAMRNFIRLHDSRAVRPVLLAVSAAAAIAAVGGTAGTAAGQGTGLPTTPTSASHLRAGGGVQRSATRAWRAGDRGNQCGRQARTSPAERQPGDTAGRRR